MAAIGTAKERERAERERAMRRRHLSIRVGGTGLGLLFLGGIVILVAPGYLTAMLVVMVLGVVLLVAALVVVLGAVRTLKSFPKTL